MSEPTIGNVFDAAHEGFRAWTPLLWDPIGTATVDVIKPDIGDRILDVCCGNGSASLPSAKAVGTSGHVDGVDLSGKLLAEARERASESDLDTVEFHLADVSTWEPVDGRTYNAIICVFGVFFLPNMDSDVARLISTLLRPRGRFAATTWEQGSVEPLVTPFAEAASAEHAAAGNPRPFPRIPRDASSKVDHESGLAGWLEECGLTDIHIEKFAMDIPLDEQRAWDFVSGAGPRGMLFGLADEAVARVRDRYLTALAGKEISTLHASALIGQGKRDSR